MDTMVPEGSRRERRNNESRGRGRWIAASIAVVLGLGGATVVAISATDSGASNTSATPARHVAIRSTTTTSTAPPTTTTTLPALQQPAAAALPPFTGTLGPGSDHAIVQAYQQRLADVHFDPGPIDGNYGQAMTYAVQTLQKMTNLPRTGRIGTAEAIGLSAFSYPPPLQPTGEGNRTEIDVAKQVLTLYANYQVRLITTTSTGSGEHYCYDSPRVNPTRHICEVATTPSGRFTYTRLVKGWDKSPLGQLYQPYYFNGGIAVHGYPSVPTSAASHGCARIPMHIAEYYPLLVKVGDPVYVFGGQPSQILSSVAIAPAPAAPPTSAPAATPPASTPPPTQPTPPAS